MTTVAARPANAGAWPGGLRRSASRRELEVPLRACGRGESGAGVARASAGSSRHPNSTGVSSRRASRCFDQSRDEVGPARELATVRPTAARARRRSGATCCEASESMRTSRRWRPPTYDRLPNSGLQTDG